jgi:phosphopantetheinyl transferase (holo-ACP synthase)
LPSAINWGKKEAMQQQHKSSLHPQLLWGLTNISEASKVDLQGPQHWHPQRREGHTASLLALSLLADTPLDQLHELHYYKLEHLHDHKELLCSRSHTQTLAAACVLPVDSTPKGVLSIGIDLESGQRQIKDEIAKFYHHPEDHVPDQLSNWCAKEAAFKAVSSFLMFQNIPLDKPLTLKDFIIKGDSFTNTESMPFIARGRIEWTVVSDHMICLAVLDQYIL